MAKTNHITVLLDDETVQQAEKLRDRGDQGFSKESDSSLYGRIIMHGLAHANCKGGEL